MSKLGSILVLVLLLAILPAAMPLLAQMACCRGNCEPMFRPDSSCCNMSATPETTAPAKIAVSHELAAPASAGLLVPGHLLAPKIAPSEAAADHVSTLLQAPLRI